MRLHESIPIVPNLFSLTYIRNPGAAFGLLAGQQQCVSYGVLRGHFAVCRWLAGDHSLPVAGGRLDGAVQYCRDSRRGDREFIDRLRYGEVIDFLDVYVDSYHWPAFNVADSAISVGVVFLIIHFAFEKKEMPPVSSGDVSSSSANS